MRIKKSILAVFVLSIILLSGCGQAKDSKKAERTVENTNQEQGFNPKAMADYLYYEDLDSISERSTDIVKGKLLKDLGEREIKVTSTWSSEDDIMIPYHVYLLEVEEVLKGNTQAGKEIEIRVPIADESAEVTEEGIYFLNLFEEFNPYAFLNPGQSNLPIEGGQVQLTENTKVLFNDIEAVNRSATGNSSEKSEVKTLPLEETIAAIKKAVQ